LAGLLPGANHPLFSERIAKARGNAIVGKEKTPGAVPSLTWGVKENRASFKRG